MTSEVCHQALYSPKVGGIQSVAPLGSNQQLNLAAIKPTVGSVFQQQYFSRQMFPKNFVPTIFCIFDRNASRLGKSDGATQVDQSKNCFQFA